MHKPTSGFTLMELLIAMAIISILTAITLPTYQKYTRRAYYIEIIHAALPFKIGITECIQITGDTKECQADKNGVPQNISSGGGIGMVDSIIVGNNGAITTTPRNIHGIKPTDTYILSPTLTEQQVIWQVSGGGQKSGYVN